MADAALVIGARLAGLAVRQLRLGVSLSDDFSEEIKSFEILDFDLVELTNL